MLLPLSPKTKPLWLPPNLPVVPKTLSLRLSRTQLSIRRPSLSLVKQLVYAVEDLGQCSQCTGRGNAFFTDVSMALTKVGMDGNWMGANHGNSYLLFTADPGEHHLCLNWQSVFVVRSRAFAMANFTAEEGKTYYFRARVFRGRTITPSIWI